jgi:pimeloyl-ACP methyl ester carboxylesterase
MIKTNFKIASVVLVHAAWADASSWNKIIPRLQRRGMQVVAVQIPLTSLSDDVATVRRALKKLSGPVVLVGHSYAGAVITAAATGNSEVKALTYIAAIVPDEGETVGALFHDAEPEGGVRPSIAPDADGFLWLPEGAVTGAVAPDALLEERVLMEVTQHPIAAKCLGEPMTVPAWKQKPSWFLIAGKDRMISPAKQRFMAERIGARIHSSDVDHTPLLSAPDQVVAIIAEAVDAATQEAAFDPQRIGRRA